MMVFSASKGSAGGCGCHEQERQASHELHTRAQRVRFTDACRDTPGHEPVDKKEGAQKYRVLDVHLDADRKARSTAPVHAAPLRLGELLDLLNRRDLSKDFPSV